MHYLRKHFYGAKKKKKKQNPKMKNDCQKQSEGPNISAVFVALLPLTEGYDKIAC